MGRVHGQRREDGEDLFGEHGAEAVLGFVVEFVPVHEVDVLVGQGGPDLLGVDLGVALLQPVGRVADLLEDLDGAEPGGGGHGESGGDAALQAGHPDHEELVEVGGEDRQEADALQQVEVGVFGQFEDPGVEGEPAQLAVQEPVRADFAFGLQDGGELRDVDPVLRGARGRHFGGAETGTHGGRLDFGRGCSGGFRLHALSLSAGGFTSTLQSFTRLRDPQISGADRTRASNELD